MCAKPDTCGVFISRTLDAKLAKRLNDAVFKPSHIAVQSEPKSIEIKDWVHHQLTRAVVGNVAAAISVMEFNAGDSECRGRCEEMRPRGGSPRDRNHRWCVFDEQYDTRVPPMLATGNNFLLDGSLQFQCFGVGQAAEVTELKIGGN